MKKTTLLLTGCALCGIAIVFYLSWLPNPDIGFQAYFPRWLGRWTNANVNVRTAVPFVFLGLIAEFIYTDSPRSPWKRRLFIIAILITIVSLAEIGQLFLPHRHFDLGDIGWGFAGAVSGITAAVTLKHFKILT